VRSRWLLPCCQYIVDMDADVHPPGSRPSRVRTPVAWERSETYLLEEEEEENICLFYMTCREASPATGVSLDSYGRT
jgi:hypothetical protein